MPNCSLCPGRAFKDDNAVRMHKESKHTFACGQCSRVLYSQQALDQHISDTHYAFECHYCDREFTTDDGRLAHEKAKHPSMFECEYCDREFTTDEGRLAHQMAKHAATFECRYCDREFNSDQAREQHEDAKHQGFECRHCDREFTTEQGRAAHEEAKHPTFECEYCDREFSSEDARQRHQDALHRRSFPCSYCDRHFTSEQALSQHREVKHYSKCISTRVETPRKHEQTTPHIQCGHCSLKFFTQDAKNGHERSCSCSPANRAQRLPLASSDRPSVQFGSNKQESTDIIEEGSSTSAVTPCTDDGFEPAVSPTRSSDSTLDEGEMFHSTSGVSSTDAAGEEPTVTEQPGACACSPEACTCWICQPLPSDTDSDHTGSLVAADDHNKDDSTGHHDAIFQCTPCLTLFETAEAFQDHVCASRIAMFRSHCPMCYSQFDDGALLQKHLEGLEFTCQLCLVQCCSEEMMQDHLLSHPTCGKCGKSFADSLALCTHVESDHPVVVCWDCDGIVVEKNSLGLHYADSPAHPSCAFCGLGTKDSADMDEHVKRVHAKSAEIEDCPGGGHVSASPGEESPLTEMQPPGEYLENAVSQSLEGRDRAPPSSVVETTGPSDGPGDELHDSLSRIESTLPSPPEPPAPQVERVNEAGGTPCIISGGGSPDVEVRQYASPSSTPSEHGSNISRLQLHTSHVINTALNNDTQPPSPPSSASSEPFSDTSTRSSPTSESSHSIVFVSADGIPNYVRENRAILVATSAVSRSSGRVPLRLPSSSSLESLEARADATAPGTGGAIHRLHCRICLRDPCEEMTATICGHLFCKRCITQAVVARSECPVCRSATLLYCLFKLDLSV